MWDDFCCSLLGRSHLDSIRQVKANESSVYSGVAFFCPVLESSFYKSKHTISFEAIVSMCASNFKLLLMSIPGSFSVVTSEMSFLLILYERIFFIGSPYMYDFAFSRTEPH